METKNTQQLMGKKVQNQYSKIFGTIVSCEYFKDDYNEGHFVDILFDNGKTDRFPAEWIGERTPKFIGPLVWA